LKAKPLNLASSTKTYDNKTQKACQVILRSHSPNGVLVDATSSASATETVISGQDHIAAVLSFQHLDIAQQLALGIVETPGKSR
jgi:hypothetical protein